MNKYVFVHLLRPVMGMFMGKVRGGSSCLILFSNNRMFLTIRIQIHTKSAPQHIFTFSSEIRLRDLIVHNLSVHVIPEFVIRK